MIENDAGVDIKKRRLCVCECECGKVLTVVRAMLLAGDKTHCGCARKISPNSHAKISLKETNISIKNYIHGLKNGSINGKIGARIYVEQNKNI